MKFEGIYTPAITPLTSEGTIDKAAFAAFARASRSVRLCCSAADWHERMVPPKCTERKWHARPFIVPTNDTADQTCRCASQATHRGARGV